MIQRMFMRTNAVKIDAGGKSLRMYKSTIVHFGQNSKQNFMFVYDTKNSGLAGQDVYFTGEEINDKQHHIRQLKPPKVCVKRTLYISHR